MKINIYDMASKTVYELPEGFNPTIGIKVQAGLEDFSYEDICKKFGNEHETYQGSDSSTVKWIILTQLGVATIYAEGKEYKTPNEIKKKVTNWKIGGHTEAVVPIIMNEFGYVMSGRIQPFKF